MTADELTAYRAEHREDLQEVAAAAPPAPAAAWEITRAAGCPMIRPTRLKAAS